MTTKELLGGGKILAAFNENFVLSVCPALGIDKIRFSVVKKGSSGKDSSDIYLDVKEFDVLCMDIKSGVFAKKIAEDSGDYPSAYKWVKGENGSKTLVIGGGKKGIRLQTAIRGEKTTDRRMLVVPYEDFRFMTILFDLVIGRTPFVPGSIYEGYYNTYWETEKKFLGKVKFDAKTDGDYAAPDNASTEPDSASEPELPIFHIKTTGKFEQRKNLLICPCVTQEKGAMTLCFDKEGQKEDFFPYLRDKAEGGVSFTLQGVEKAGAILFKKRIV